MKKILAIGHSFVLAQNRDVFRCLHTQGDADVTVMAPRFFHGDLRDIHIEPEPANSKMHLVPIDCYLTSKIHLFAYNIFQIEKVLKEQTFDAVYLWEEPYIVSGFTLAHIFHKYKIPYFFYSCQNIYKKYPWPFSFFESKAQVNAAGMYACGVGVKEVLAAKDFPKSEVLPFFVSLDRFKPLTKMQKKEVLGKMNLHEEFTVGFMGRLVEEKGIHLFMKAMDTLLVAKKCNIMVIGSGPLYSEVREWVEKKKNAKLLTLKHDEVPKILPTLDVLLCPSQTRSHWKEQFGRMIVEAFAAGVVVVGSRSGEIPYVIDKSGIVLSESNVNEWVKAVEEVMASVDQQGFYVQRGFQQAKKYSVENVASELIKSLSTTLHWK